MNKIILTLISFLAASCSGFMGNVETPYGFIKFNKGAVEITPPVTPVNVEEIKNTK